MEAILVNIFLTASYRNSFKIVFTQNGHLSHEYKCIVLLKEQSKDNDGIGMEVETKFLESHTALDTVLFCLLIP